MVKPTNIDRPNILVRFQGNTDEKRQLDLRDRLIEFKFQDREKGADLCFLTLENHDLSLYDEEGLDKGSALEITWGYPNNFSPTRQVIVKKSTGFEKLKVEAYGREVQLNRETKCQTFTEKKRSQIVQEIALKGGFKGSDLDIEDTKVVFETVHQAKQTDAQFIKKLAEKEGFQFYIDFDGFHFHKRRLDQTPVRTFTYYHDSDRGDVISIDEVDTNISAKPGAVRLKGRNSKTKENYDVRSTNAATDRDSLAGVVLIIDPESSNRRLLRRNASEQVQTSGQQNKEAAKREADGRYRNTQLSSVKLKLTVIGDPSLVAKSIIVVNGISELLSGRYYVTEAMHTITDSGYSVQLTTKRDGVSTRGATSKGEQNTKKPDGKDIRTALRIDPETGRRQLLFRDTRGRVVRRVKG
jgi:hypothetical protein